MREVIRRIAVVATALVASLIVNACGTDGGNPTGAVTPPVSEVKVVSITVSGDATLVVGTTKQYSAIAKYSDGSQKDVTSMASWGALPSTVISVSAGAATALQIGNVQVTATFGAVSSTMSVVVQSPPVVFVSAAIVGDTTLEAPIQKQYRLVGKYSDGSEKDLIATWSYPNPDYLFGEVNATGVLTPHGLGIVHVQATYQGVLYTLSVRIIGTLRSKMAPVSDISWALVKSASATNGAGNTILWRLKDGVTKVWANPIIPRQNVVDGLDLLVATIKGGRFSYTFVVDSAASDVWLSFEGPTTPAPIANHCGVAGGVVNDNNTRVKGFIWLKPECLDKTTIAHEMAHVIGPNSHTPPNTDILSPGGVWSMSKDLADALNLIMSLPSGTILIDG